MRSKLIIAQAPVKESHHYRTWTLRSSPILWTLIFKGLYSACSLTYLTQMPFTETISLCLPKLRVKFQQNQLFPQSLPWKFPSPPCHHWNLTSPNSTTFPKSLFTLSHVPSPWSGGIYSLLAILRVARHVLSLSLGTCCSFYQECAPYFTLHIHMATFLSSFKGTVSVSFLLALSKMYTSKPLSALFYHLRTTWLGQEIMKAWQLLDFVLQILHLLSPAILPVTAVCQFLCFVPDTQG